jgi:hypothetical protein
MNSVQEAASKGVPVILIPLFADQYRNAKMLEYQQTALALNAKDLTVEKLTKAINEIIEDDRYNRNAKKLAEMIAAKPMSAEERVVRYTEFAAQFGPDLHLDMYGRQLNFLQFYCLDIIIPAMLLVFVALYLVYRLIHYLLCKIGLFIYGQNKLKCS